MRELERDSSSDTPACRRLAIIGRGRLGGALAAALSGPGSAYDVSGPLGRGASPTGVDAVLLCVPDAEIAAAAALIFPGPVVGHCSGATGLDVLAPHEAFSFHPLMTVTASGAQFAGAGAATAGTTPHAAAVASQLATSLGMRPFAVPESDRAAYHASASIASNFLVTLEGVAERLAATAGVDREALVPLVRATVENWAALGAERALTGPVARGDTATVEAQRAAVADRTPDLLALFDALVSVTRMLAAHSSPRTVGETLGRGRGPGVITVRTVADLRSALAPERRAGATIGLVPTMGALHEGHLSLLRAARQDCDIVVMSLFVNPTQFNESADLAAYPRDEQRDTELAEREGVDYLFAPAVDEVYPSGFATTVRVAEVTETLEGVHRGSGHFDGVATVVTKLFNMVGPDVAYFGQKDAQQAVVIKRLVRDLDMPVRIEVCPTVREPDGLAMSSRNARLSADERQRATALSRALSAAQSAVSGGERDPAAVAAAARSELDRAAVETEYFELVSQHTLVPVSEVNGDAVALVAARVGQTRLIDNQPLSTAAAAGSTDTNGGI